MAKLAALPINLPPRLLSREAAAAYVSVCAGHWDKMVAQGIMPQPKMLGQKRRAWDIREIDLAVDRLPTTDEPPSGDDGSWSDVDAA